MGLERLAAPRHLCAILGLLYVYSLHGGSELYLHKQSGEQDKGPITYVFCDVVVLEVML